MNLRDKRRVFLALEQLEDRWVPATISFYNGILSVTAPIGNLTLTQTSNNTFQIVDSGGHSSPSYGPVSSILIDSGNGTHNTTIALGGNIYTGNLVINQHNGADSVGINNGSVLGNTLIATGTGNDTVALAGTASVTFGGNVTLVNSSGIASVNLGATAVKIGGSLGITGAATVTQGASSVTVGGAFTIQDFPLTGSSTVTLGGASLTAKSLSITGGQGADSVSITNATIGTSGFGSTQINLGQGNDTLNITGTNTFNGPFNFTSGVGSDSVNLGSASITINGNASINTGQGNDTVTLGGPVFGNLSLTNGSGNDSITVSGQVYGNLFVSQGNGNDTITVSNAPLTSPFGTFYLNAGNGNDSITLGGAGANGNWTINFNFGTGSNTVTLNGTGGTLFGYLNALVQNPDGNVLNGNPPWINNLYYQNF